MSNGNSLADKTAETEMGLTGRSSALGLLAVHCSLFASSLPNSAFPFRFRNLRTANSEFQTRLPPFRFRNLQTANSEQRIPNAPSPISKDLRTANWQTANSEHAFRLPVSPRNLQTADSEQQFEHAFPFPTYLHIVSQQNASTIWLETLMLSILRTWYCLIDNRHARLLVLGHKPVRRLIGCDPVLHRPGSDFSNFG